MVERWHDLDQTPAPEDGEFLVFGWNYGDPAKGAFYTVAHGSRRSGVPVDEFGDEMVSATHWRELPDFPDLDGFAVLEAATTDPEPWPSSKTDPGDFPNRYEWTVGALWAGAGVVCLWVAVKLAAYLVEKAGG